MITLVPAATPVITPVLVTVAMPVETETHGVVASGVPEPVKVMVAPSHTVKIPVMVGKAFTVTVNEQVEVLQPSEAVHVTKVAPVLKTTPLMVDRFTAVVAPVNAAVIEVTEQLSETATSQLVPA